jgi:hypothetical protein
VGLVLKSVEHGLLKPVTWVALVLQTFWSRFCEKKTTSTQTIAPPIPATGDRTGS